MPSDDQAREAVRRAIAEGVAVAMGSRNPWLIADRVLEALDLDGYSVLPPGECVIEGERWRLISTDRAVTELPTSFSFVHVEGGQ